MRKNLLSVWSAGVVLALAATGCSGDPEETPVPDVDTGTTVIDTGSTTTETGADDTGTAEDTTTADTGTAGDTTVADTTVADTGTAMDTALPDTKPGDVAVDTFIPDTFVPGVITVTPTTGLKTTESGGTATFTVVLGVKPSADVTIAITSSDVKEGTASPGVLTFTAANFATPQTVTVTGVDDFVVDGAKTYTILTAAAVSADTAYSGRNASDVTVTNDDNDKAGITVTPTTGLRTNEDGSTATFTIKLDTQPTADVTIGLTSSLPTEGTVSASSVVFTTTDWNTAKTITVTGVDDGVPDGDKAYKIVTAPAASADTAYATLDAADVDVVNVQRMSPDIITSKSYVYTAETGTSTSFTVKLATKPGASVTVPVTIGDSTEGQFAAPAPPAFYNITFTPDDWDTPRTVTVVGKDDLIDDDAVVYNVAFGPTNSTDATYNALSKNVQVENADNDAASYGISATSGIVTNESGTTGTFTVRLNTEPAGTVTVPITSMDTTEGLVSKNGIAFAGSVNLTFDSGNWETPQTVTVKGADDAPAFTDGNVVYNINVGAATGDAKYAGLGTTVVAVTNEDVPVPSGAPSGCTRHTFGGHDYLYCTTGRAWSDAVSFCADSTYSGFRGSHLVRIDSASENMFLNGLSGSANVWIGFSDLGAEGTWKWTDGTTASTCTGSFASCIAQSCTTASGTYTNWAGSEPNNCGVNEHCAHMWGGGGWNDHVCSNAFLQFCEINGTANVTP